MGFLSKVRRLFTNRSCAWWQLFSVTFGDRGFTVTETTLHEGDVAHSANWSSISAVCFQDGGLGSDLFYVYTSGATEPILVPVEACGGELFWSQLTDRGLFPESVSAQAVRSTSKGSTLWWPTTAAR